MSQTTHSAPQIKTKGKEIPYRNNLKFQQYLLANNILTLQDQRAIFSFCKRMNNLKDNFSSTNTLEHCKCGSEITNIHLDECNMLDN